MKTAARELKVHTVCQMILAAVAVGAALYFLRSVLLPFILALFFVTGVAPVLHAIEKKLRAPRMVAVAIAFLLGIVLFTVLWLLVWLSVASLLNNADNYRQRIAKLVVMVEEWFPDPFQSPDDNNPNSIPNNNPNHSGLPGSSFGAAPHLDAEGERGQRTEDKDKDTTPSDDTPDDTTPGEVALDTTALGDRPIEPLESASGSPFPSGDTIAGNATQPGRMPYDFSAFMSQNVGMIMSRLSTALMDLLSSALMVLIFMFFLLLGDIAKAGPKDGVWGQIESGIRNYIVTKTVISVVTGAAFGIVLWFFGVPLALVFGLLAFFLNYIPNIGPIIASVLPLPLILLHPDLSVFSMVVVIVLTSGIQFASGNVLEPKIMGDSFDLHPVVILLTLVFWGMLWGIVGMFLATPITAAIKILLDQFEHTRPIARWLEGRFG